MYEANSLEISSYDMIQAQLPMAWHALDYKVGNKENLACLFSRLDSTPKRPLGLAHLGHERGLNGVIVARMSDGQRASREELLSYVARVGG